VCTSVLARKGMRKGCKGGVAHNFDMKRGVIEGFQRIPNLEKKSNWYHVKERRTKSSPQTSKREGGGQYGFKQSSGCKRNNKIREGLGLRGGTWGGEGRVWKKVGLLLEKSQRGEVE